MQEAVAWLVKLSPCCFCSACSGVNRQSQPGRIIHYPALTNWRTRAATNARTDNRQHWHDRLKMFCKTIWASIAWDWQSSFKDWSIWIQVCTHKVSWDESDSRYKVLTFHIIFYSLQRRWAGPAGSCKEGGICNGLWGLIWSNRNRKYEMEISPHRGQSHTVSWGKTNPAIIFQLLTTQPGWVALVTQHRGIILPCRCCAL